jgi:surface-anchored protein
VPLGTHAHGNWVFTREGAYRLTFTMSARLTGGATSQDTQTLAVQVGTPATPEPTATATPAPSTTPTPAPTPPPTGTAPTAPTLRTLSASLRGRTLTLRVRLDRTSRVSVTLRRNGKPSARAKARTLPAGTRTVRLSLDRRPKAGRHTVRVTATADGRSATRTRTLRVR